MKNTEISQKIKELRNRKGFSQEQLAETANINLRTVQRIEAGETEPRGDTLKRIANALNVAPDELIDRAEQDDKGFLVFLNISALCFIVFPLLGIIVPLVIWMLKKDKVRNINETGKRLVNFQITWCLVVFLLYALVLISVMFNVSIPLPNLSEHSNGIMEIIMIMPVFYVINGVMILINSIRCYHKKKVLYQPAIRFLR
ncbi:helix-turn-helix domain-containing protein [Pedobacter lusitanus]|uniref:helix-turn-helix domain-containing protein n=1 Tax=Pedobacter lusitanus TaxID=1503925 RepID=UPI00069652F2|nr:helix-turn-helix domain-containing protein [Pedobacter lusitanus]